MWIAVRRLCGVAMLARCGAGLGELHSPRIEAPSPRVEAPAPAM